MKAFGQAADTDPEFTNALYNKSLAHVNLGKDTDAQSQRALIVRKMTHVGDANRTASQDGQTQLRV